MWLISNSKQKFPFSDYCSPNPCHANATCNSTAESCVCNNGFTGNGYTCTEELGNL